MLENLIEKGKINPNLIPHLDKIQKDSADE